MKKVWIGVGVGCGSLILLFIIAVVAGGIFVGKKMEGMVASGQALEAQEQALAKLNQAHPFSPPPEGEPLALAEPRLVQYLQVRAGVHPLFQEFQTNKEQLEGNKDVGLSEAMAAMRHITELMVKVRGAFLTHLKKQQMSPAEFNHLTATVYQSQAQAAAGAARGEGARALAQAREELERELGRRGLSPEEQAAIEAQLELLDAQLASLGQAQLSKEAQEVFAANAALLEKHRAQVEEWVNPTLDAFLLAGDEALPEVE